MIKVCHIADHLTGKADGIFTQLYLQFKFSDKNLFENHLVLPYRIENLEIFKILDVRIIIFPNLSAKFPIKAFFQIINYIRKNKIDVLHIHFLKPYALVGILNTFLRRGCLYNYHGLSFDNLFNTKFESRIYKIINFYINMVKSCDLIITPSNESKLKLLNEKRFRIPIESYYLGMDLNLINDSTNKITQEFFEDIKKDNLIVGTIARIDIAKRIDNALIIFKTINKYYPHTILVILGDGDKTDEMKLIIEKMGLEKKVYLMGYIPNARLYIRYFDIFLLTSDYEGFPIVIWESMASGVPIVSSDVGGIKEIIENENCGYTYPVNNLTQAEKLILDLISDEPKRIELGRNGLNAITNKYSPGNFICKIQNIYKILASHN